jgi:hypothetical protein
MDAKRFVAMMAGLETGYYEPLDGLILQAREIHAEATPAANAPRPDAAERRELAKQAKDKGRAEAAIDSLDRFLANPDSLRSRSWASEPPIAISVILAAQDERDRLCLALGNPEALRMIYRRNEARR